MKVYLSSTIENLLARKETLEEMRQTILDSGASLTRDWIPAVFKESTPKPRPALFTKSMLAIHAAEVCIFEVTEHGMSIGYQIAHAIDRKKPTLLLVHKRNGFDPVDAWWIAGNKSGYFTMRNYTSPSEAKRIVQSFLKRYRAGTRARINLALPAHLANAVAEMARQEKRSRTDIINLAIEEKVEAYGKTRNL